MSERPVPRRHSPWVDEEVYKREVKANRCNDRVEDVIYALFEGNPFRTIPAPFKLFYQRMRSKPGYVVPNSFASNVFCILYCSAMFVCFL
ncbi:hypothetical protein AAHA92_11266 [Salvia divinorum]|uniref:Uncharacterized protein n=1 Tax=Salvia divinorum TaxID=28513 RepID=A0ABD1HIY9_SALDI